HGLALQAVQAASPRPACVGLVSSYSPCVPASASAADAEAARRVDAHLNRIVLDPVLLGAYPVEVIEHYERHGAFVAVRDGDLATISQPMGFLGTNYYSRRHVTHPGSAAVNGNGGHEHGYSLQLLADLAAAEVVPPGVLVSEIGLPIEAEGLRQTLCEITDRYGPLPIYVTENGLALHDYVNPEGIINDQARIEFMHEHVEAVAQAIEAGCDVRGYFAWSLLDNLEWHLGYAPRFGLVYVDFATQRRYPKRSYAWYQDFIERQGSRARPRTVAS
ncbi:MAG TPA: family 1 glycosylhydrolase, partial [Solirubrobacteraceae bacterium]|nr:family 1 glycosylhydrolase [Solirubrobacteraceae bacterium]